MKIDPIDQGITMVSGDTELVGLELTQNAEDLKFVAGDKVYFSVKKNISDTTYLFQAVADLAPTKQPLKILPEHTKNLAEGTYWYDIQMTTAALGIKTIVWPTTFTIVRGVTHD